MTIADALAYSITNDAIRFPIDTIVILCCSCHAPKYLTPLLLEKPQPVRNTRPIVNIPPVKMQHLANAIGSISNQHPRASFSSVGIRVLQGAAASAGLTIQYREAPGRRRQDRSAPSTPPAQAGTAPCAGVRYCTMCTSTDGAAGGHGGAGSGGSRKRSLL